MKTINYKSDFKIVEEFSDGSSLFNSPSHLHVVYTSISEEQTNNIKPDWADGSNTTTSNQ